MTGIGKFRLEDALIKDEVFSGKIILEYDEVKGGYPIHMETDFGQIRKDRQQTKVTLCDDSMRDDMIGHLIYQFDEIGVIYDKEKVLDTFVNLLYILYICEKSYGERIIDEELCIGVAVTKNAENHGIQAFCSDSKPVNCTKILEIMKEKFDRVFKEPFFNLVLFDERTFRLGICSYSIIKD